MLALVTCGEKTADPTGDGSTGSPGATDSASSTGSVTAAESTDAASTDTPTGGGSSTGAAACEALDTPIVGPEVTVTLRNSGAAPIFLGSGYQCDNDLLATILRLVGPDSQTLAIDLTGGPCETRCSQLEAGRCGCGDGCSGGTAIQIDPGGAFPMVWSGGFGALTSLPSGCFGECAEFAADGCHIEMQAPAATYTFSAEAYPEPQCFDCVCTANADGWCAIEFPSETHIGQPKLVQAEFNYPDTVAVELVF